MVIFKWQDLEGNTGNDRKHYEKRSKKKMMVKYHLYDENYAHKGSFTSITQMRIICSERNMTMMIELIWMINLIISNLLSGIGICQNNNISCKELNSSARL